LSPERNTWGDFSLSFATEDISIWAWVGRNGKLLPPEGKHLMILAPLAAAVLAISVATAPTTDPTAVPSMSARQKSAAVQPLVRSATECIARAVRADSRFGHGDLGDLIVDSMSRCTAQVRAMIDAYDHYFGNGEGEAFFLGPYLDVLPSAVSKWAEMP
jgi:hypothetical protein